MKQYKKKFFALTSIAFVLLMLAFMSNTSKQDAAPRAFQYYQAHLDSLKNTIVGMQLHYKAIDQASLQQQFKQARHYYKKIEFLIEYYYPETANKLNAPNLLEAHANTPNEALFPTGFQVLEEAVFDTESYNRGIVNSELSGILFAINRLEGTLMEMELDESSLLDALKLNLYRLIIKGISGFDSPVAFSSLSEASSTMQSTIAILGYFDNAREIVQSATKALEYLHNDTTDFVTFNRAIFITKYINPLCDLLHDYQVRTGIPFAHTPPRAIPAGVPNLFNNQAFDLAYFAPSYALPVNEATVALGKRLFHDTRLSGNQQRSCASCHNPAKAFTDGLKVNESLSGGQKLLRNTPTLINAALQPVQFYDSRISFLEDQVHEVVANPAEMGGVFHLITANLQKDKTYRAAFKKVSPDGRVSERNIKSAIAAYIRSLVSLNSPFDQYMRGDDQAMGPQQVRGFNLFMGKAKCGTCHFMPLFNGTAAPLFDKMESEVLGVPAHADTLNALLDTDSGKYLVFHIPHHLYSFKTTGLRNSERTAPYMHNGVYNTLEEVIDFYDRGGGAGLGFRLAHQTLPPDRLHLTPEEKQDLVLFIKALTDIPEL